MTELTNKQPYSPQKIVVKLMITTKSYANMPKSAATLAYSKALATAVALQAKVIEAMKQQQELLSNIMSY